MYGISQRDPSGSILIEGQQGMDVFRMLTLEGRLKMEIKGLHFRGPSARTLAREWYGLRGSKQTVLEKLQALRAARYPVPEGEPVHPEHIWGPLEQTRLTGAIIQRCTIEGCKVINPYADE